MKVEGSLRRFWPRFAFFYDLLILSLLSRYRNLSCHGGFEYILGGKIRHGVCLHLWWIRMEGVGSDPRSCYLTCNERQFLKCHELGNLHLLVSILKNQPISSLWNQWKICSQYKAYYKIFGHDTQGTPQY